MASEVSSTRLYLGNIPRHGACLRLSPEPAAWVIAALLCASVAGRCTLLLQRQWLTQPLLTPVWTLDFCPV